MRLLYDIFFIIFSIFYVPNLLWKGKLHGGFLERFGFLPKKARSLVRPIWIHAVSVGEAALAAKLSRKIKETIEGAEIIVSTTTRTGNDMALKSSGGAIDAVFYYPLDLTFIVRRVVRLVNPSLYIMVETELWPNLLSELRSKGVSVILANGRISEKSFVGYKRIRFITGRILDCISYFCMQSSADAERIKKLGARDERVCVTGNIKFDGKKAESGPLVSGKKELGFGENDKIFIAGSTHFPEEKIVIDAYKALKKIDKDLRLILVPRHIERTDAVKIYIEKEGLGYRLFSDILKQKSASNMLPGAEGDGYDILLVDTIGHLKDLYAAGDIVFIGGSFAKKGGQNPIEAARWGKAVIFGPHMFNFREVADIFLKNKAAVEISDPSRLREVLEKLLSDTASRENLAGRAQKVIEDNSGAIERTAGIIAKFYRK